MGGADGPRECAPDDKLRDTHHVVASLCEHADMTGYRRNFMAGGSFFFTVNLAERRLNMRQMPASSVSTSILI
jgi:hypothetical protein